MKQKGIAALYGIGRSTVEKQGVGSRTPRRMRNVPGLAAVCAATVLSLGIAQGQDRSYHFDIANQSLSQALRNFAHTCGQEVVFTEDIVAGRATSLHGDYTVQGALDLLLLGTDLVAERSTSGAIMILRRPRASDTDAQLRLGLGQTEAAPVRVNSLSISTAAAAAAQTRGIASSDEIQEITVTGLRDLLVSAENIKRKSLGVVDVVVPQDIGQFPDASIGEAIARIPGVAVNRGSINNDASAGAPTSTGQVSGVTVRGFGAQFNEVLWDGRPVASGNGQNFDFSVWGAEYVGQLEVLKTPDLGLSSGAIGATINIKSPEPFDKTGLQARAFFSGNDYQNDGSVQPAFGALISDTFADDTIGVLVAGDYTSKHITAHHFDIAGWEGMSSLPCADFAVAPAGSGCRAAGSGATGSSALPSWYPQDQAMYLERTDSRRRDGRLALQWRPSDAVLVTLDDNFSSDDELASRYEYSTWFGCFPAGCTNITQDANGTITNFLYSGPNSNGAPTDFHSIISDTYIVTNTPGVNLRWDVNDQWKVELDASASESRLNPNGSYSNIDANVGYGPNTNIANNGYFGGTSVSANANTIPHWTAVGPSSNPAMSSAISANYLGLNPFIIGSHVVPLQTQENTDKIKQARLEGAWYKDDTTVHFGAQFVDDTFDTKEFDTFSNNEWELWSGYGPASNNVVFYCGSLQSLCANQNNPGPGAIKVTHGVPLPPALFTPVSVPNFIPGFHGNGNLPQSLLMFNPYSVLSYLSTQPADADYIQANGGSYTGGMPQEVLSPNTVQHVERKNYSPFVTVLQSFSIHDMRLDANLGLRWQKTQSTIAGLSAPLLGLPANPGDRTAYTFDFGPSSYTVVHNTYSYALPSLDINLLVKPNLKIRFDASRTETAPNNNQLIPFTTYSGRVDALSATANNPNLLPYLSSNFDLGAEWYYADGDYLAVDSFFKRTSQFPVSHVQPVTVSGVINTTGAEIGKPAQFAQSTVLNGLSVNVAGVEFGWQQMLIGGFGFLLNGIYLHSGSKFNPRSTVANQFALAGIDNSANLIGFYQKNGFQARIAVQWQAKQLLQLGQEQNDGAFGNEPTYLQSNTEVDFSASYDIDKHLSVFFEAFNLLDSVYHTSGRFDNQTLNLVDYGRSFAFGVHLKL